MRSEERELFPARERVNRYFCRINSEIVIAKPMKMTIQRTAFRPILLAIPAAL